MVAILRGDASLPPNFAGVLLLVAIAATILPPGYSAYVGAYVTLAVSLVGAILYGRHEYEAIKHPPIGAIGCSIALVASTVPFVYHSAADLLAPLLLLPLLSAAAISMLAQSARWAPRPALFASLCLAAAGAALLGGAFEHFILAVHRPGLGNNPIHYASLSALSGCLAVVGLIDGKSRWRYVFLLGPTLGIGTAVISGSRGPLMAALVMTLIAIPLLAVWLRREKLFLLAVVLATAIGVGATAYLIIVGNDRVVTVMTHALNIFAPRGDTNDIRTALYASAIEVLKSSPWVGRGLGQIMDTAKLLFPEQPQVFSLENLHADWANFGAMAGGIGLLAWLLLLSAPLLILLEPNARKDRVTALGTLLLVAGQFVLGISNATFGILPQTTLYAIALGYFLARQTSRREKAQQTR